MVVVVVFLLPMSTFYEGIHFAQVVDYFSSHGKRFASVNGRPIFL